MSFGFGFMVVWFLGGCMHGRLLVFWRCGTTLNINILGF